MLNLRQRHLLQVLIHGRNGEALPGPAAAYAFDRAKVQMRCLCGAAGMRARHVAAKNKDCVFRQAFDDAFVMIMVSHYNSLQLRFYIMVQLLRRLVKS